MGDDRIETMAAGRKPVDGRCVDRAGIDRAAGGSLRHPSRWHRPSSHGESARHPGQGPSRQDIDDIVLFHEHGRDADRGGQNAFSSPIHKSETVDYGILLAGERVLVLDNGELVMNPGDVVVQLGNWHGWTNPRSGSLMAFVMMGAKFEQ